jgi:hypothetical protein
MKRTQLTGPDLDTRDSGEVRTAHGLAIDFPVLAPAPSE